MAEVKKSDIIYIQNELLGDIAKLDKKLSDKITQLTSALQYQKLTSDQKYELSTEKYNSLLSKFEAKEDLNKLKEQLTEFKSEINQNQLINTNKIFSLEKDLVNTIDKYDNLFNSNIYTPGLIGHGGKYKDIKAFREFVDKKIAELTIYKEKNNIDMKKYKEKTDNAIAQIKLRSDGSEKKYFEFCYEKINEAKNEIMTKFNLLEESLNNLKIENGKYSYDLLKKSEDLQNQINTMKNIEDGINVKLNEQAEKYQNYNNNLVKLFESQNDEFKLIKSRFTELSDFIKDVRFMRNLDIYQKKGGQNNEINSVSFLKDSRMLSKKINFDKPQKLSRNDEIKISNIKTQIEFEDNKNNNEIKNDTLINLTDRQSSQKKEEDTIKIKNIIKTGINNSKELNSPKKINNNINKNNNNNIETESISINSSVKKNKNMNNILSSFHKGKNQSIKIDDSFYNKTSRNKGVESRNEEMVKNKSDIYFFKKNKTQENNNIDNNLMLNKISKNFLKENNYFSITNKIKKVKDLEIDTKLEEEINNENNENNIQTNENKIFEFIDKQIIEVNQKIKDMNEMNKHNIDKMNKKFDLYINLNNALLLKFKYPKNLSNKQTNILTNNDYSIPLINKTSERNKFKTERIKIKPKGNSSILNLKDIKDINDSNQIISSGKILSIIEPYLIKKFRNESVGGNNK